MSKLRVSLFLSLLSILASFRSFRNFRHPLHLHEIENSNEMEERDVAIDEDAIVSYMMGEFPVPTTFQLDQQAIEKFNAIENIDYTKLAPDDPRFVDMPYPTEAGPLSAAYAKHMLWRRSLNTDDRVQWQKWALYKRLGKQYLLDYSVEDFVIQNLMKDAEARAQRLFANNQTVEATLWSLLEHGIRADHTDQVKSFIMGFYKAFNCKNPNLMRPLWLPTRDCELVIPGFKKVRGNPRVDKLYRRLFTNVKPFCKIEPEIVTVQTFGNLAVVVTIENVGRGYDRRPKQKIKGANGLESAIQANNANKDWGKGHQMLAISVVRRANKQWRMLSHTSTKLKTSSFTNNQINASSLPDLKTINGGGSFYSPTPRQLGKTGSKGRSSNNNNSPAVDDVIRGLSTLAMKAKQADNGDGESEMVVSLDNEDGDSLESTRMKKEIVSMLKLLGNGNEGKALDVFQQLSKLNPSLKPKPKLIVNDVNNEDDDVIRDSQGKIYTPDNNGDYDTNNEINLDWPIPRQTVHILRILQEMKLITEVEKGILIKQVVDGIASEDDDNKTGDAFVATAYKTIFLDGVGNIFYRKAIGGYGPLRKFMYLGNVELKEFAQQCKILLARLNPKLFFVTTSSEDVEEEEEEKDEEESVSTSKPMGFLDRIFGRNKNGAASRPVDFETALTPSISMSEKQLKLRKLLALSLLRQLADDNIARRFEAMLPKEIRVLKSQEAMQALLDLDLKPTTIAAAFADLTNALVVALVDQAASVDRDDGKQAVLALEELSQFMENAATAYKILVDSDASIEPLVYNGKIGSSKLESLYSRYLKSCLDMRGINKIHRTLNQSADQDQDQEAEVEDDESSTQDKAEKAYRRRFREERLGRLQFLFGIKENKRASIEKRASIDLLPVGESSVPGLNIDVEGIAKNMIKSIVDGNEVDQQDEKEAVAAVTDLLSGMKKMSPKEMAELSQKALATIKQQLKAGTMSRADVLEFEKMLGKSCEELVEGFESARRDPVTKSTMAEGVAGESDMADLEWIFKQLLAIKRKGGK